MKTRQDWLALALAAPVILLAVASVVAWPVAALIIVGVVILIMVSFKRPHVVSPALVLVALPFMRPNILGGNFAIVATALCLSAAFIALIADSGKTRVPRSFLVVSAGVFATYVWVLANAAIFGGEDTLGVLGQGAVTTAVTVAAVGFVIADPRRRRLLARGFVWIVLALCASYAITLVTGIAVGFGSLALQGFDIGKAGWVGTIYLPFTPSVGYQGVGGITFPRFTGLGREPGWMSMYAGVALLLWPRVGRMNAPGVVVLLVGLLGAFSTAGFGAFVVAIIIAWMSRKAKNIDIATHFFGMLFKIGALGFAGWIALTAPVFGFMSKRELNADSLDDRTNAMNAGLSALVNNPLGGVHTGSSEAINLVAALAPYGIPYFIIVVATLLLPRLGHPARGSSTAPIALILITLVLSQPAGDSTFVFILGGLIYACALPDMSSLLGTEQSRLVTTSESADPHMSASIISGRESLAGDRDGLLRRGVPPKVQVSNPKL